MVDQECEDSRGKNKELHSECVMVPIIRSFELAINHPDSGEGASYVDHLTGMTVCYLTQGGRAQPVAQT